MDGGTVEGIGPGALLRTAAIPLPLGRGLLPSFRRRPPAAPQVTEVTIDPQPLGVAAEWQAALAALWHRHRRFAPALMHELLGADLLRRCCLLASDSAADPRLRLRVLSEPTVTFFGRDWARRQLGRPHLDDPHALFAARLDDAYTEAIEGAAPRLNRVSLRHPDGRLTVYTHLLVGWTGGGRRAVLSGVDF